MTPGTEIGSGSIFNTGSPFANGLVSSPDPVYLGLRFRDEGADLTTAADDTVHYGYALISLPSPALTQAGMLISYAYESTPGAFITIPVPEAQTGALAIAATGLLLARRRRK